MGYINAIRSMRSGLGFFGGGGGKGKEIGESNCCYGVGDRAFLTRGFFHSFSFLSSASRRFADNRYDFLTTMFDLSLILSENLQ